MAAGVDPAALFSPGLGPWEAWLRPHERWGQDRLRPRHRAIARGIPGARLVLYPDAGHAFLFQDGVYFAVRVDSFLAGG
jgi:hypothetical protein